MARVLIFSLLAAALVACALQPAAAQAGVAIYLPREQLSGREMLAADLGSLPLQAQAFIPADEILSYSASSHDLALRRAAIDRLAKLSVPVQGLGFVICDGSRPLVAGAFWTLISSLSFEGLTINVPFGALDTTVHLYSGYPMMDGAASDDPRDDPRLLEAFRRDGKLR
jgi:hypothetical protein